MAIFFYKALEKSGGTVDGELEGSDDKTVALKLQNMGLMPIHIGTKQSVRPWDLQIQWPFGGVSSKDVMFFTQELSTLVNAGLPLDRSLVICKELSDKPRLQSVVGDILEGIRQGKSFADSLSRHPKAFSKLYVNMVRAGEASGSLPTVLDRLVEFQQSADELKSYLISSLIYPSLLTFVGGASVIVLLNYVIPKFAEVFQDVGQSLPLPTQILLTISETTKAHWWWGIVGAGILLFIFSRFIATNKGRLFWDKLKLKITILGQVLSKIEVARISKTLGTLVHNAVPLVQSLNIVKEITGNKVIANAIQEISEGVKEGEGVAVPMKRTGVFPPLAIHLVEVGEETGRLDDMLLELSRVYDKEVRSSIKNLITLFEPLMILVMGIMVGAIVISMLLAIVSINEVPL